MWDLPTIIGACGGVGGLGAMIVALLKVRPDARKTDADAAAVLAGAASGVAEDAREAAKDARAEADAARRENARLSGKFEALHARVAQINLCSGGQPCPMRLLTPAPSALDAPSGPQAVVVDVNLRSTPDTPSDTAA